MVGANCTQDILFHPIVTIRAFGWRVFFRAVFVSQGDKFLSFLQRDGCSLKRRPRRNSPIAFAPTG